MKLKGPDGQLHDVEPVSVENASERWNEYLLSDGTVLRMKLVLADIYRFPNQWNELGAPLYSYNAQTVISTSAPDTLRRPE